MSLYKNTPRRTDASIDTRAFTRGYGRADQKRTLTSTRRRQNRHIAHDLLSEQIDFLDLELTWVSSDQVRDSLESSRRALVNEQIQLNIPVSH
jgi:hypothetical protein